MTIAEYPVKARRRWSNWPFHLWLTAAVLTILVGVVLGTAWAVRHAMIGGSRLSEQQAHAFISVAEFPGKVDRAVRQLIADLGGEATRLLLDRQATERVNWERLFPAPTDTGYLLFSGIEKPAEHSVVRLIRVSDGATMARWDPDWRGIYAKITDKQFTPRGTTSEARAIHPILLSDGDIIFKALDSLVRMGSCSSQPLWVLDEPMHHSNELDATGSVWTPSIATDGFPDNRWLHDRVQDDALARVSADGQLLERHSFSEILRNNGLQSLLLGTTGNRPNDDPIHLNQIAVAPGDSRYWRRGDLLISARHLSTVVLYRPSTGRILWHQLGPWMNQHSVDFVDDHRISVFDNNVVANAPKEYAFVKPGDTNRVLLYDFDNGQISEPFAALLAEAKPVTFTEGRARVLPDGGLFIEETNYGRHLRFTRDRLLWSRVNDYDDKRIGMVSWSRYLTAEEARGPLLALAERPCEKASAAVR
jgi:hypothetical protein